MRRVRKQREVDVDRLLKVLDISVKNHNGELWARCPFPGHDEKTPSWSIKVSTGAHYCQGCKEGGGPADLVMRIYEFAAYSSALDWLEEQGLFKDGAMPLEVQVELTRPDLERREVEVPKDVRFLPFDKWITPAKRYALQRGITHGQVDRWGLGYATGGYYAYRLLLPTREYRTGRLLNISGRTWSPSKTPKYLNSKLEHGWDSGAVFGEQHWSQDVSRSTLVLCEGELNALACERVGAPYVGALGGSSLENEQVLKISRFGQVLIAVDMDRAGTRVAEQLHGTLARWNSSRVVQFPDRRDPNDLERANPKLLRELLCLTSG